MYGGGYGSYGSYGGYGGMGGYGSMGSYGGMGSSYGGYGSSYGLNRTLSNQNQQINPNDPNRPPQPQINQRKILMQQYFKMMGGLRSMVQIGFCMVALCNFGSKSWKLLKRFIAFLARNSKKLFFKISGAHFLTDKMALAFQKAMMLSPNSKNGKTLLNKCLTGLRIAAAIVILMGIKVKSRLNREIQQQHDQNLKNYEKIKLQEVKIQQKEKQLEKREIELHTKQGYF